MVVISFLPPVTEQLGKGTSSRGSQRRAGDSGALLSALKLPPSLPPKLFLNVLKHVRCMIHFTVVTCVTFESLVLSMVK